MEHGEIKFKNIEKGTQNMNKEQNKDKLKETSMGKAKVMGKAME